MPPPPPSDRLPVPPLAARSDFSDIENAANLLATARSAILAAGELPELRIPPHAQALAASADAVLRPLQYLRRSMFRD